MNAYLRESPERLLRAALVVLACLCAFAPLLVLSPRAHWWQEPWLVIGALLLGALSAIDGELRPERADDWGPVRARRFAPAAGLLLIVASLIFPTLGPYWILWSLLGMTALLLPFAFVPRVRTVVLCLISASALGLTVLDDSAAWSLLPLGLVWSCAPALDRMAAARLQLPRGRGEAPGSGLALGAGLGVFAVGATIFALALALLPESTRAFAVIDLLAPRARTGAVTETPELPSLELFGLVLAVIAVLFVASRVSGNGASEPAALELPRGLHVDTPQALARALDTAGRWPAGPRRELVRAYLEHRLRLANQGLGVAAGTTPEQLAESLPTAAHAAARSLASRFAEARWTSAVVDAEAVRATRDAIDQVELALKASRR